MTTPRQILQTRSNSPSRRRARLEATEAHRRGLRLPPGHPYEFLPIDTPFWIARPLALLLSVGRGKGPA